MRNTEAPPLSFDSIIVLLCISISLSVSLHAVQAAPIGGLSNTGVNDAGMILPAGTLEPHYEMTGPASPARVITPHPFWVPGARRAAWIGPSNGNQTDPVGTYTYTLTFDLTGFDPTTAVITGTWSTDNNAEIFLNEVSTGVTSPIRAFEVLEDFSISGNFVAGLNTLEFVVNNISGGSGNPSGLLVANLRGEAELMPGTCNGLPATITGSDNDDILIGTDNIDVIQGSGGNDTIYGFGGDDVICGGDGHDTILGGDGNDILNGNAGHDVLIGGPSDDDITGGAGNDILSGEGGNDMLLGGAGNDSLDGGTGDDKMTGNAGPDICDGGTHAAGDRDLGSCNITVNIP